MTVTTRQQKMAEAAFSAVSARQRSKSRSKEYDSFAKSFPSLIQAAGLCHAITFAQAKGKGSGAQSQVLDDVRTALNAASMDRFATAEELANSIRKASVTEYLRLSRVALQAATWIKRYVEALDSASSLSSVAEPSAESS